MTGGDTDAVVLLLGYQRELTYQHDDGSFSAFGNSCSVARLPERADVPT